MFRTGFVLGLTLWSTSLFAQINPPPGVRFANSTFHDVFLKCPERIWPGMDWSQLQLMFVSGEKHQAWLVSASASAAEALRFKDLPLKAHADIFEIFEYREKTTIAVNLEAYPEEGADYPLAIAAHELLHEIAQPGWAALSKAKGDLVPFSSDARYLRIMMYEALQKYADGDSEKIQEAKHWFALWSREFPEEVQFASDANEGTATYAEVMSQILGHSGCNAPAARVDRERQKWIDKHLANSDGLNAEGYYMGAAAGFLLDRKEAVWKTRVAAGETPLHILFDDVPDKDVSDNKKRRAEIASDVESQTGDARAWIGAFETELADPNYVRVALPQAWQDRVISYWGEFIPKQNLTHVYRIFNVDQSFSPPHGTAENILLAESKMALSMEEKDSPCPGSSTFFLVRAAAIVSNNKQLTADSEGVVFKIVGEQKIQSGFRYICTRPE